MSTPQIQATMRNVVHELGSASSALHMPPCPIKDPDPEAFMLDELDETAEHASQHISAAVRSAVVVMDKLSLLEQQIRWGKLTDLEMIDERLRLVLKR